jgi:hypothetical protein
MLMTTARTRMPRAVERHADTLTAELESVLARTLDPSALEALSSSATTAAATTTTKPAAGTTVPDQNATGAPRLTKRAFMDVLSKRVALLEQHVDGTTREKPNAVPSEDTIAHRLRVLEDHIVRIEQEQPAIARMYFAKHKQDHQEQMQLQQQQQQQQQQMMKEEQQMLLGNVHLDAELVRVLRAAGMAVPEQTTVAGAMPSLMSTTTGATPEWTMLEAVRAEQQAIEQRIAELKRKLAAQL